MLTLDFYRPIVHKWQKKFTSILFISFFFVCILFCFCFVCFPYIDRAFINEDVVFDLFFFSVSMMYLMDSECGSQSERVICIRILARNLRNWKKKKKKRQE